MTTVSRLTPGPLLSALVLCVVVIAIVFTRGPEVSAGESVPRGSETARSVTLVRHPYLQRVGADTATVVWATREPGPAEVRYHSGGPVLTTAATTTLFSAAYTGMTSDYYQHEATLPGLQPATTYDYDVYVGGIDATETSDRFTTAPSKGTGDVSFAVFGDSGSGTSNQLKLAQLMSAHFAAGRWDLALHTGDVVYPSGTFQTLQTRFFDVYRDWLRRYPIFPAIGNHEDYAKGGRPYLDLFSLPDNGYTARYPDQVERYYSFDYGPVHFVALDTQLAFFGDRQREQLNWLVRDLEATTQPWRVVFFHVPAYGSSDFASDFGKRNVLEPIFERYGVQLVLAGHEHAYARGGPWKMYTSAQPPVMHVVTGGGGASLNSPTPGPWLVNWARAYHYLGVTVSDCAVGDACALMLQAIGLDGNAFDTFTLDLRSQQADAAPPQVSLQSPPNGAVVQGEVTVAASANDDQGIAKVDLWVDGALRMVDATPPYEWAWDTTRELNGNRAVQLRALDIAGHVAFSETHVVRVTNPEASLLLLSPASREGVSTNLPYRIRWAAAEGATPLTGFRVDIAPNGKTFQPISECSSLPATARQCVWNAPAPVSSLAVVRVTATDALGGATVVTSPTFRIQSTVPSVRVHFPDKAISVGVGSTQALSWATPLGFGTWNVELSRDGGATWEMIAPGHFAVHNGLRWTVREPFTSSGLIRVTSLNTALQDVSNAYFTIAAPTLTLTGPTASTVWTANTRVLVRWATNLGEHDRLNVRLSTDGGATFPTVLAGGVAASARVVTVTVPALPTSTARIMVESLTNAEWRAVSPVNFRIVPP